MALIKCPECGKEISDKASTCPSCGCPIKANESVDDNSIDNNSNGGSSEPVKASGSNSKNKMYIIIVAALIAVAVIIVLAIKLIPKKNNVSEESTEAITEDTSKAVYDEAVELIESGNYEDAKAKFETIPNYKDVATILDQIPWETRTLACIDKLKNMLKSPDSLKVYDVVLFGQEQKDDAELDQDSIDKYKAIFGPDEEAPVIVIHYGGENTMGGMTDQVTIFVLAKETNEYFAYGHTQTLDKNKASKDEEGAVFLYNVMNDNFNRVGDVNIDRINAIIKNGVYTNVKIIDE